VLDVLGIHPDIIDELEQLGKMLLHSSSIHSAEFLWEAAWMCYDWAGQTAEGQADTSEMNILLEDEEYKRALIWAEAAREIDPTVADESFIEQLKSLLKEVSENERVSV